MLKDRIITALIAAAALLIVLFALPAPAARAVIFAVFLLGAWEWAGFLRLASWRARGAIVVLAAALLLAEGWAVASGLLSATAVFAVALAWWSLALVWLFLYPTQVARPVAALAGVPVLLPAWLALDLVYRQSPALLLFLLVLVWAADVGAYFAGKRYGRVKLAPAISPGKTWEGVLGGLLLVGVVAVAGARWFDLPYAMLLPFAMAIGLVSVVGDLTVSIFKRGAGIKDSGSLFPGHGGLLDRIDSVTAAAPLFALGLGWTGQ